MNYISPLSEYKFNLKAKKLEGLARLSQLKIPTVSNLFIVSSKLYEEFNKTGKLPKASKSELGKVFESIIKQGDTVTLRNSIYEEKNPGLAFSVHNTLNIKDYDLLEKKIVAGYRKAAREAINPKKIEFSFLLQSFYSSEKCGTLLSSNSMGHIYIQGIHGQHTTLLLRGDIEPDIYEVSKHTYKLVRSEIALKIHRMKKMNSGIRKVKVKQEKQKEAVLDTDQIKKIAKLSQQVEKQFGPQEIEWAILDSGKIIFQETRDFKQSKKVKWSQKADVVFPNLVEGKVINLKKISQKISLSKKIVITNNLNVAFINKLAFLHRPKAIIITKGSVTSHAATVLREAKITTVYIRNISIEDGVRVKIDENGNIEVLEN